MSYRLHLLWLEVIVSVSSPRAMFVSLSGMWSMMQKVRELEEKSAVLDQHLAQVVPPCRGAVFKSLASVGAG